MPAKLKDTPLRREVKVFGVDLPVVISLTSAGLGMKVKGCRIELVATWAQIANKMPTQGDVKPSYLANDPIRFLQHQATSKRAK